MKIEKTGKQSIRNNRYREGNFWYLFIGLLIVLLGIPAEVVAPGFGRYSMTVLFTLFMLISVWSLSVARTVFCLGMFLALVISTMPVISLVRGPTRELETAGLLLFLLFAGMSSWIAARNVFVLHRVDLNSMVGAFCVYLLLGLIWATLYRVLQLCGLGGFSGGLAEHGQGAYGDLVYFSFVTLASLGYGDIVPIGGLVRTLAYMEAVTGQFYLAVLVASLVSAYIARRTQDRDRIGLP